MTKKNISDYENHNPIQQTINKLKEVLNFRRLFGTYGSVWYFLGIQTLFIWGLKKFSFCPETFLRIDWVKRIEVSEITGHENGISPTQYVSEQRYLYLYNPFKITTFYGVTAPDKKVVVQTEYGDEIETHEFYRKVMRAKLLWWKSYRVTDSWTDDETEFDRGLDSYLSRGY
jgi:hypothetical protein|tara:strand:- start:272 stop:787 length:516 start_codon:yes stop_codon:yes gene_type:complete